MLAKSSLHQQMQQQFDAIAASDQSGAQQQQQQQNAENHPVIRTLYDHADEITTLAFHPFEPVLVSGSRDYTIKVSSWFTHRLIELRGVGSLWN